MLLFNDTAINQIIQQESYKDALVYFICKVKKVRFDLASINLNHDTVTVDLLYHQERLSETFTILNNKKLTLLEKSNSKKLEFQVEGVDDPNPMVLTPDLVVNRLEKELGNRPEIIYIGYSFDPIKRLRTHEKIVKANAELDDNEELRLYINSFKFSFGQSTSDNNVTLIGNIGIKKGKIPDTLFKNFVKLVERVLIHFFQTEGLNDNHITMNLMKDPILKKLLRDTGIRFFGSGFEMFGTEYFDFWSQNQTKHEKSFFFDFANPDDGYLSFADGNERFLTISKARSSSEKQKK